jgi:hypothetical protein
MILPTLLTNDIYAAVKRDFKSIDLKEVEAKFKYEAPKDTYVLYDIYNGWNVINSFFLNNINLKLNRCEAVEEIVAPLKDELAEEPGSSYWYQEPIFLWGVPVLFVSGFALGFIVAK